MGKDNWIELLEGLKNWGKKRLFSFEQHFLSRRIISLPGTFCSASSLDVSDQKLACARLLVHLLHVKLNSGIYFLTWVNSQSALSPSP